MNCNEHIFSYGTEMLRDLKVNFLRKAEFEEEYKEILYYIYYLEQKGLNGDLSKNKISREQVEERLGKVQNILSLLNKKIDTEVDCVMDIKNNIDELPEEKRFKARWNKSFKKLEAKINENLTSRKEIHKEVSLEQA